MKTMLFALLLLAPMLTSADQYVRPHVRSNGSFVNGYMRSSPNSTTLDNYSHNGNINPYTGERGYLTGIPSLHVPQANHYLKPPSSYAYPPVGYGR